MKEMNTKDKNERVRTYLVSERFKLRPKMNELAMKRRVTAEKWNRWKIRQKGAWVVLVAGYSQAE